MFTKLRKSQDGVKEYGRISIGANRYSYTNSTASIVPNEQTNKRSRNIAGAAGGLQSNQSAYSNANTNKQNNSSMVNSR